MTEKQKEADKRYRDKVKPLTFAISYKLKDMEEGKRLQSYLEKTGQSANSYIKSLIKKDLDVKEREEYIARKNAEYEETQELYRFFEEDRKKKEEERKKKEMEMTRKQVEWLNENYNK